MEGGQDDRGQSHDTTRYHCRKIVVQRRISVNALSEGNSGPHKAFKPLAMGVIVTSSSLE